MSPHIIPNCLQMALGISDEARVITQSKAPFPIVSVNEAWTRVTGYTQVDVEGKDLSILNEALGSTAAASAARTIVTPTVSKSASHVVGQLGYVASALLAWATANDCLPSHPRHHPVLHHPYQYPAKSRHPPMPSRSPVPSLQPMPFRQRRFRHRC